MRRSFVIFGALLLTVFLLAPALAQMGGPGAGNAGGQGRGAAARAADREGHETQAREWNNLSETARTRGLERAEEARLFARFTYADGTATGRFVTFSLDPVTGVLRDYAVRSGNSTTSFFATVTPSGFVGNGTPAVHGARLSLDGQNATFSAHNNPTGLFQYRGEGLSVAFEAASGATVTADNNRTATVAISGQHGHVIATGNGTLTVSGTTITVSGAHGVLFAAHPTGNESGMATANLHAVRDALTQDRVGGMLSVVNADGAAVTDATYMGVAMRARNVSQGRANVTVSSPEPAGKSVVIFLDETVVNGTQGANVTVTLDGRPVPRAANAAAALNASTGQGVFHVTNATQGVQVIVSVPGFSEHDIGITTQATTGVTQPTVTTTATPTPTGTTGGTPTPTGSASGGGEGDNGTPGPALAFLVLAFLGAALVLRRR